MSKYKYGADFKINMLKKKIKKNDIIKIKKRAAIDACLCVDNNNKVTIKKETNRIIPKKCDVATCTSCKVNVGNVRKAKADYYHNYHNALEHFKSKPQKFKKWLFKNSKKLAFSTLLVVTAVWLSFLAVEKEVLVVIDGIEREYTTNQIVTSIYADKVAEDNKLNNYKVDAKADTLKDDSKIDIRSEKNINLTIMNRTEKFTTYTNTLEEFLDELEPNLEKYKGKYSYYVKEYPQKQDQVYTKDLKDLNVYLMSKRVSNQTITKEYKTKYIENDKLESGKLNVKQKGEDTKYIKTKEVVYLNNQKYKTNVKVSKVISKGKPKIVERGTKATAPSNSVWDRLSKCETGGRWHANTGNGFYGGLQFSAPTWRTAAGKVGVTAPYAHLASKEDQIKAATWLQKNSGWGQWPACSSKLGLR